MCHWLQIHIGNADLTSTYSKANSASLVLYLKDISIQYVHSHYVFLPKRGSLAYLLCLVYGIMKFESHPWKLPLSLSKSNTFSRPLIWLLNNFQICSLLSISISATLVQTPNTSDLSRCHNLQTHLPSPIMPILNSPHSSQTSLFTLPSSPKPWYNLSVASQCSNRLRL